MDGLLMMAGIALLSAVMTTGLLYFVFVWKVLPRIEERVAARLEQSREDIVQAVERGVRRGLFEGVASSLPSREALQDTTRTIARTGMEMMGDGLSAWLGSRRQRRKGDPGNSGDENGNR